jgi:hypothetical protein
MIDQILKDRKPGEKPRFFLHDEMKAWLADNLRITIQAGVNHAYDYTLGQKLKVYSGNFPAGIHINVEASIADELFVSQGSNYSLHEYVESLRSLATVSEECMFRIVDLQRENEELKRRLDLIENPLPL